jgi:hypothetical protein
MHINHTASCILQIITVMDTSICHSCSMLCQQLPIITLVQLSAYSQGMISTLHIVKGHPRIEQAQYAISTAQPH